MKATIKKRKKKKSKAKGKKSVYLPVAAILSAVVVLLVAGFYIFPDYGIGFERPIVGVLLETGDVYFGRLSYFPRLKMTDVYVVQSVIGASNLPQAGYQVVPLEMSVWGPGEIVLNRDKVVFIGKVGEGSQVMAAILQRENQ